MTLHSTPNITMTDGADGLYGWITAILAAGWTVPYSGDGTTTHANGTWITSAAVLRAAAGWWIRVQDPGGIREYTVQKIVSGANNSDYRIKYSAQSKFTGGSQTGTRTPSASDEKVILGAGSDPSPTFIALFGADNSTQFGQTAASDSAPYHFFLMSYDSGAVTMLCSWVHDPLLVGTFPSADTDPAVQIIYPPSGGSTTFTNMGSAGSLGNGGVYSWLKYGLGGAAYVSMFAMAYQSNLGTCFPAGVPQNPHAVKDDLLPIVYARNANQAIPTGFKGISNFFWGGNLESNATTLDVYPSTRNMITFGNMTFYWTGEVPIKLTCDSHLLQLRFAVQQVLEVLPSKGLDCQLFLSVSGLLCVCLAAISEQIDCDHRSS